MAGVRRTGRLLARKCGLRAQAKREFSAARTQAGSNASVTRSPVPELTGCGPMLPVCGSSSTQLLPSEDATRVGQQNSKEREGQTSAGSNPAATASWLRRTPAVPLWRRRRSRL